VVSVPAFCAWADNFKQFNFTIPRTTPPGKYLMRIENFYPTPYIDYQQFYVNCAFVNIMGPGGGKLSENDMIKFPPGYQPNDPGMLKPTSFPFCELVRLITRSQVSLYPRIKTGWAGE
jgi:hypothetical protein